METVLVTGAGGYIGSNAAEYFVKAGYRVVGTVRNHVAERLTRLGIETVKLDLADAADLSELFEKKIDYVIHFGKWRGRNRWPLAHVENVCRALHAAMILPEAGGEGVTVLDSRRITLSEYYRELAAEFLPGKRLRECSIPMWTICPVAALSTALSRKRDKPLFDPTLYALDTVSHNLDFSNRRMLAWFAKAGLEEFHHDSYR